MANSHPAPHSHSARSLFLLGIVAALLLAADWHGLWKPFSDQVSGDTLIHLVFARNCADGRPFEYNIGFPSRALTAPLWNWLLAGVGMLAGSTKDNESFLLTFRLLSLAVLGGTLGLVWHLSRRLGATTVWAASGLVVLLTNPSTFYWTVANPMETSGAALISVLLSFWAGWVVQSPQVWRWLAGGLLTAAGFLVRPELLVFGILAGAAALCFTALKHGKNAAGFALALGAGMAGWTLFMQASGLAVLPNAGSARRLMLLLEDASFLPLVHLPYSPDAMLFLALFAPLLAGTAILLFKGTSTGKATALAGLFMAGFCLLFFTFYFYTTWQGRYLLPAIFAITPPGVAGLSRFFGKPLPVSMVASFYCAIITLLLLRPLSAYADAPQQRSLPRPEYVRPEPGDRRILCQEIQSAYFYPQLFHICTEGLIGLEALEARRKNLSVLEFIREQKPDLIGVGRYPLRDPEDVARQIRAAAASKSDLSLPGLELDYLGPMEGCGPVFRVHPPTSQTPQGQ